MDMQIKDGKLVIIVDVSPDVLKNAPKSASGKSRLVATTSGFTTVGKVRVGLNVITS